MAVLSQNDSVPAVVAAIGNGAAFRKGRQFAAWMGVVPREHSTGGKQKLRMINTEENWFPCPVCLRPLDVRTSKRKKPYVICSPCGVQMFIRERAGIEAFEALVEQGIPARRCSAALSTNSGFGRIRQTACA